jgi:hypothetical protein
VNAAGVRRFVAAVTSTSPPCEDVETITAGPRAMRGGESAVFTAIRAGDRVRSFRDGVPLGLPWEVRESEPASIGRWFSLADVYRPDPLLFIGAAANEGR